MPYVRNNQYETLSNIWSGSVPVDGRSSTVHMSTEGDEDFQVFNDVRASKPMPFYPSASSDLEEFFQAQGLSGFIPFTRMAMRRGGFQIDGYPKVTKVSELARVDSDKLRAFFSRRETYEPMFTNETFVAQPSKESIERTISTLRMYGHHYE